MSIPDKFYSGDTLEWPVTVASYPPSAGWTLTYWFAPRFASPVFATFSIACAVVAATDSYALQATPTTTATWPPGFYNWWRRVTKAGAAQTLDDLLSRGVLQVLQNPATAAQGFDNRTQAQKGLDDARLAFSSLTSLASTNATSGQPVEFTIAGRSMRFESAEEARLGLVKTIKYWENEVAREDRRQRIAAGLKDPRNVFVRAIRD